ncbi:hypothetical protein [Streptomyces sp. F001]|nr:hypothetical protein [Streptomyces sp. F001]
MAKKPSGASSDQAQAGPSRPAKTSSQPASSCQPPASAIRSYSATA